MILSLPLNLTSPDRFFWVELLEIMMFVGKYIYAEVKRQTTRLLKALQIHILKARVLAVGKKM